MLVGIAVVTLSSGLSSMTNSFRRAVEREELNRLASEKYDELVATGDWVSNFQGEFADVRYEDYEWELETEPTSVTDLEYLRVTVTKNGPAENANAFVEGLVYRQADDAGAGQ